MRYPLTVLCTCLLLLGALVPEEADAQITIGPRAGFDLGDTDQVFIGTDLRIGIPGAPIALAPAFDFYFADGTAFNLDINGLYYLAEDPQMFDFYAGAGLGFFRRSTDNGMETARGLNLLIGTDVGTGEVRPYIQAKTNFGGDVTLANLMLGFNVRF